jgi:pimeloyl-ACP methyl ester carboxylesterase
MDYVEMAEDVLQLIDRLELKRPMVMGHSMGGKVAMALALRHPARIAGLIVVDIAPVSYADTLTPFAEAMRSANVMAAASGAEVQRRLQQAVPTTRSCPSSCETSSRTTITSTGA